jgi:hypothetical protein
LAAEDESGADALTPTVEDEGVVDTLTPEGTDTGGRVITEDDEPAAGALESFLELAAGTGFDALGSPTPSILGRSGRFGGWEVEAGVWTGICLGRGSLLGAGSGVEVGVVGLCFLNFKLFIFASFASSITPASPPFSSSLSSNGNLRFLEEPGSGVFSAAPPNSDFGTGVGLAFLNFRHSNFSPFVEHTAVSTSSKEILRFLDVVVFEAGAGDGVG